ncbi:MAG TPA: NADH:flavin oxidoreductase [Chloroflexota bacterium]|nr:NADH:flavin oxidoreductase [Chloroflexota bacterium]
MSKLGTELTIKGMHLRNRLVLPPITGNYASTDGEVTPELIGFYRQRARQVGLAIVEAAAVRGDGRITPRSLGIWHDGQLPGLRELAGAIKAEGAAAVIQLGHAGAGSVPVDGGIKGASPSGVRTKEGNEATALSTEQIAEIRVDFVAAALRAKAAGFDGVEIHGAHLYLLSQFMSPLTNQRTDGYGGDLRRRMALPLEVVRGIRGQAGDDFVILFRMNTVEMIEGGMTVADAGNVAMLLEDAGVDVIHASLVAQGDWIEDDMGRFLTSSSRLAKERPFGANLANVARVTAMVGVPVIAVGKCADSGVAEQALADGVSDMIAIGRQMIADPKAPEKLIAGRDDEIVRCTECMGCFACIGKGRPVVCSVNKNPTGEPEYA